MLVLIAIVFALLPTKVYGAGRKNVFRYSGTWTDRDSANASRAAINHALSGRCGCPMCQGLRRYYGSRTQPKSPVLGSVQGRTFDSGKVSHGVTRLDQQGVALRTSGSVGSKARERIVVSNSQATDTPTQKSVGSEIPAHQKPTPIETVERNLATLHLSPDDVLADLGSGWDARVLVRAVELYGCKGIGIEIDPLAAAASRKAILKAVADNRIPAGSIKIITGDAREFEPAKHGVTAITAYLYPDLLAELVPILRQVDRVSTPFHRVEGMRQIAIEDIYVKTDSLRYVYVPFAPTKVEPAKASQAKTTRYYFTADWCQHCRRTTPIVNRLKAEGIPIDVLDAGLNQPLIKAWGIESLPAFVVERDGKRTVKTGAMSEAAIRAMYIAAVTKHQGTSQGN